MVAPAERNDDAAGDGEAPDPHPGDEEMAADVAGGGELPQPVQLDPVPEEEAADGTAKGPYTQQQVLEMIGEYIPCRRVGLTLNKLFGWGLLATLVNVVRMCTRKQRSIWTSQASTVSQRWQGPGRWGLRRADSRKVHPDWDCDRGALLGRAIDIRKAF